MPIILIIAGLAFVIRPRLFWRNNPRWFNTGFIQLLFPQHYDPVMRSVGGVLVAVGLLTLAGVLQ
jgi:hypothetical protein